MHDMTAKLSGLEVISHMRLRQCHRQLGSGHWPLISWIHIYHPLIFVNTFNMQIDKYNVIGFNTE